MFNNRITYDDYTRLYRPILLKITKDCMDKAKQLKSKYSYITDKKYIAKDLRINHEDIDDGGKISIYVFDDTYTDITIAILDGSQDSRSTSGANKYLNELKDYLDRKYKNDMFIGDKKCITIDTGDGDEGSIYIEFNKKLIKRTSKKPKYKSIAEGTLLTSLLNNIELI